MGKLLPADKRESVGRANFLPSRFDASIRFASSLLSLSPSLRGHGSCALDWQIELGSGVGRGQTKDR